MVADNLPTQSVLSKDPWNGPDKSISSKEKTDSKYDIEDPWLHSDNKLPHEPYHLKGNGAIYDINPSPPWSQPVKKFSVDETLLVHAAPEGFPPLPDVQLKQLPAYLWRVKWAHVPENIVYWYSLKYRCGYNKLGVLGGGNGTSWPMIHYMVLAGLVGYFFNVQARPLNDRPHVEFY